VSILSVPADQAWATIAAAGSKIVPQRADAVGGECRDHPSADKAMDLARTLAGKPPDAVATESFAGNLLLGPVCPNPDTDR